MTARILEAEPLCVAGGGALGPGCQIPGEAGAVAAEQQVDCVRIHRRADAGIDLAPQGLEAVVVEACIEGKDLLLDGGAYFGPDVSFGVAQQRVEHRTDDAGDRERQRDREAVEGAGGDAHRVREILPGRHSPRSPSL